MQKIISISLALLLIVQTFNPLYQIVYYQLNKDFIAEVLCINKDKPELNCNGKCYLAKKIKESEQEQEEKHNRRRENIGSVEYVFTETLQINTVRIFKNIDTPIIKVLHPSEVLDRLFRPPR